MCLYHYLYFSSCQHGKLSQITYCDKAKALGLAKQYVLYCSMLLLLLTYVAPVFRIAVLAQASIKTTNQIPRHHCLNHPHHLPQAIIALHIRTVSSNIATWQLYHHPRLAHHLAADPPQSTKNNTRRVAPLLFHAQCFQKVTFKA